MPYGYNNLIQNTPSFSTSSRQPRNSAPYRGMNQLTDLLSLIPPQEVPKKRKAPHKRNHNHLGAPSTAGLHPGGKRMPGNDKVVRDTGSDADADESSSAQEDEDADDEDEEEPDVDDPARVIKKRKCKHTDTDHETGTAFQLPITDKKSTDRISVSDNCNIEPNAHLAGHISMRRTYSTASTSTVQSSMVSDFDDGAVTETDDEPAYPHKKVAHRLSTCDADSVETHSQGTLFEVVGSEAIIEDRIAGDESEPGETDEGDGDDDTDQGSLCADDIPVMSEEDDEEIDEVEAKQLAREFELQGPDFLVDVAGSPGLPVESDFSIYDGLLSEEDCVGEPGLPGAHDWNYTSALLSYDNVFNDNLFSVPVSRQESPGSPTRRPNHIKSPRMDPEVFHSDEWSDDDENIPHDADLESPFFEKHDPAVRHMVKNVDNQQWGTWMESEDENVWQAFETGDSSGVESESNDEAKDSEDEHEHEDDYDSDATDLEENLPAPTPEKESKLKRLSSPNSTPKPQVLHRDPTNKNGPLLGSWIADPDRPICIIDGTKKTFLVPANTKRFSLSNELPFWNIVPFDESDFDVNAFSYGAHNPTLSAVNGDVGGYMDGDAIFGRTKPVTSAADFLEFDELLRNEYDEENEDSFDEEEQMLSIEDLLALSESDEDGHNEEQSDVNLTPIAGRTGGLMAGENSDANAMLSRWDSISVTAFRKRQQQHQQRLTATKNKGALKGKLSANDTTMTPARRRRTKTTNIKTNSMNSNWRNRADDTQWSTTLPPLYEA